jgi:TolB protein
VLHRDGADGLIAFTRYRLQDKPLWSEIWVSWPDGSHQVKVSHSPVAVEEDQARVSPDGSWIAFDRCPANGAACSIWLVRPDGSGQRRLSPPCRTTRPTMCPDDSSPSFTPDGRHVVFTHAWGGVKQTALGDEIRHSGLARIDLDGSHLTVLRQLTPYAGDIQAPRVSPDGRSVVFDRYNSAFARPAGADALFVTPLRGGVPRQITPWRLSAGSPSWSPDGTQILFERFVPNGSELTPGSSLYTIHRDGTHLRRVTDVGGNHFVLAGSFSPDGTSIVYATDAAATANPRAALPFADVFTAHLDGTNVRQVTHTANLDGWPTWGKRAA